MSMKSENNYKGSPVTLRQLEEVLDKKLDRKFDDFALIVKAGFDEVDRKFERIDQRFDGVDHRLTGITMRLGGLDKRMDDFSMNYRRKKVQVKY